MPTIINYIRHLWLSLCANECSQWNIRLSLMLNFAHFQICESLTWLVHSLQPPARSCAEIAPHYRLIELLRALCDFSVDEESQNKGFRHNTSEWYSAPLRIHRCTSRIRFYSPVSDYLQHIPGMLVLRSLLAPGSHSIWWPSRKDPDCLGVLLKSGCKILVSPLGFGSGSNAAAAAGRHPSASTIYIHFVHSIVMGFC